MLHNFTRRSYFLLICFVAFLAQVATAQVPTITSFSPTSGNAGTTVNITGTNFSSTPANNVVYFGLMKGTVTAASATTLQVTTPLGATYGPLTITNTATGLVTISTYNFMPTFSGGTPGFKYRQTIDTAYMGAIAPDFDEDGKCDFTYEGPTIYKNNSTGGVANLSGPIAKGAGFQTVAYRQKYADLNGDGKLDLYGTYINDRPYTSVVHSDLGVQKNTSTGGNVSFEAIKPYFFIDADTGNGSTFRYIFATTASDFDGDGKLDVIVYEYYHNKDGITIYRNQSTVANIDFSQRIDLPVNFPPNISTYDQPLVGDINGDGKPDLVYGAGSSVDAGNTGILVYLNNSTGVGNISFAMPTYFNLSLGGGAVSLRYVDMNNDGKLDIVSVLNTLSNTLGNFVVLLNTSTGANVSFASPLYYGPPKHAIHCEVSDFNGDGKLDIVTHNGLDSDSTLYVYNNTSPNDTTITFDSAKYRIKSQYGWKWGGITVGDLDNDGKPDIIASRVDFQYSSINFITGYPRATSILFNGYAAPTSTVTANLDTFTVCNGVGSATQSFTVASSYLPANVVITASAGFQVSTSATSGFASSITLVPSAGALSATVYVRVFPSDVLATTNGSITIASDALVEQTIPVVAMFNEGKWTGIHNNDFHNAINWTGCYPAANINITIPNAPRYPLLTQLGTINNLNINTGGWLEITGKLQISGEAVNSGVLDADNGSIELNTAGSTTKYVASLGALNSKIKHLIVNQTNVATGKLWVDSLTLTNGTLVTGDTLFIGKTIVKTGGIIDAINSNSSTNTIAFNGVSAQTLNNSHFLNKTIKNLLILNTAGVSTNGNLNISGNLGLNRGVLTTNNDTIIFPNAGTATSTNNGYVNGNVRKVGNQVFTFPVGNAGKYAPISISAPTSANDHFTASYVYANPNSSYSTSSLATGLIRVSTAEYWLLKRTNGSSTVSVTLSWDTSHSKFVGSASNTRVANWSGTQWTNQGNTATTGVNTNGTVKSNAALTNYGVFTLGSTANISTNASITGLSVTTAVLSPAFNSSVLNYTDTVNSTVTSGVIIASIADANASVYVNGAYAVNGSKYVSFVDGVNTFTVLIVAEDGVTTKTYTITITKLAESNADLSKLVPSVGSLLPTFAAATTNYVDTVATTTSSITITPTVANAGSTVKVNGSTVNSGSASSAITLAYGNNTVSVVVTAADGVTTKTYSVIVHRRGDNNCNLSALVVNTATIAPTFASATTSYAASVANTVTSVTIKPTTSVTTSTVKVNGVTVASGSNSGTINLNVGANTISTVVTAQDGSTTKTYTVTITRAGSSNANLSALSISSGPFNTTFNSNTTGYTASVANNVTSIDITPTLADVDASLKVNTISSPSGVAYGPINLNVGSNTITVVVTAANGTTTKTYTVTVTRASSTNNNLANLTISNGTLSPVFASATTSYTDTVAHAVASVTVTPTTADATATVKVNNVTVASGSASNSINLNVGSNTINVVVTSQSNATKTYTITVVRLGSSNPDLSALTILNGTLVPAFASATTNYVDTVDNTVTSTAVKPTVTDAGTTIKVNGVSVNSGSNSSLINLSVGNNTINVVTTSGDGSTTKTYTITVYRMPSTNANLTALIAQSATLSPSFATNTISYTSTVISTVTTTRVSATVSDATATIKINGVTTASGVASANIPINIGSNTITVVVTAQDGVTTKTYTIVITRGASSNANLSNLIASAGGLSPTFNSSTTNYTVNVGSGVAQTTVTSTLADATASLKVNGVTTTSGVASANIPLNFGSNTINVVVTAQDGTTIKTYTITIVRACGVITSTSNLSVCTSQLPYSWNGLTFNTAGTQTAHITLPSGCDSAATLNLSVNSNSPVAVSISPSGNNVCAGTAVIFTATPTNGGTAPTYQWKKNGNNVGTNSATYLDVTLNNNDSVWCVLTSNSACISGGSTVSSNRVKMIIKPKPASFIIYNTNTTACTIGSIQNVTSNAWNTMWSSSDTNVATITYPGTSGTNGGSAKAKTNGITTLYCTIAGANGCTNTQSILFKVDAVTPAIISGASSGCVGSTIPLTADVAGGVWTSSSASQAPVSTGGVVSCNSASTPTISYKITNSSNCNATTTKALTINTKPATPTINFAAGTNIPPLKSGVNFCNNRNFTLVGSPAGGVWGTTNALVATVTTGGFVNTVGIGTGSVTYTVTNAANCSSSSSIIGTVVACSPRGFSLTKDPMPNAFTIYPNPSTGVFNIKVEKFKAGDKIVITDIYGKQVYEQNINSQLSTLNSTLTKGMYLVSVITEGGKETRKVIIND